MPERDDHDEHSEPTLNVDVFYAELELHNSGIPSPACPTKFSSCSKGLNINVDTPKLNPAAQYIFSSSRWLDDNGRWQDNIEAMHKCVADLKAHKKPVPENTRLTLDEEARIDAIACVGCGARDREEALLLCDNCDDAWHLDCLQDELEGVPEGEWNCPKCEQ